MQCLSIISYTGLLVPPYVYIIVVCVIMLIHKAGCPDEMSLIPWSRGWPLLWDFISSDTLAPSKLSTFASGASWLANSAEPAKIRKYSSLTLSFYFSPLCVETLGAWGSCARPLVRQIGSWVMEQSGDNE